jgi:hypothetical protein
MLIFAGFCSRITAVHAEDKHMGVATCSSSNCHGSIGAKTSTRVLQNEYSTWFRHEAHSRAYEILTNQQSKTIARNLAIGSAENEPLCLNCHATYVPTNLRGNRFRISDGVGCESCHGAAERYLRNHTAANRSHAENIKDGMTDLSSLTVRANLCMDCHVGNEKQNVNHRLIAAGHPRLTFELDTFSLLQPNHWQVDDDYVARKGGYVPAQAWLIGQALRASEMLAVLTSKQRAKVGVLPELSLFTCYSCHHSLSEGQWKQRTYGGRPGELHLNVSSLVILKTALTVLAPDLGAELAGHLSELANAYPQGQEAAVVQKLQDIIRGKILPMLKNRQYPAATATDLLRAIVSHSASTPYLPYEIAEQSAMAMSALNATIDSSGGKYEKQIGEIYQALKNEKEFKPEEYTAAAGRFKTSVGN